MQDGVARQDGVPFKNWWDRVALAIKKNEKEGRPMDLNVGIEFPTVVPKVLVAANDKFIEAGETQAPAIDRRRCLFRSWPPPYRKSHLLKSEKALFSRLPSNCWVSNDIASRDLRCSQDSLQFVSSLWGENGQFATERYYPRSGFARMWLLFSISNRIYEKKKK